MRNLNPRHLGLLVLLLATGSGVHVLAANENEPPATRRSALMQATDEYCHTWSGEITAPIRLRFPIKNENALVRTKKSAVYYTISTPEGEEFYGDDALHWREPYLYFVTAEKGEYALNVSGYPDQTVAASYEVCEF